MEKFSLVSIVITCYNQAEFIEQAINSVLNQTYSNIECIIIDDGSSDNTSDICNKYLIADKRIKYYYFENQGVSISRNEGFALCSGQFIHFLDGDDFIAFDKIEKQVNYLNENPSMDICYSDYCHYFHNNKFYQKAIHRVVDINPIENFLFFWDRDVGTTIHSALFRRNNWIENESPFPTDYKSRYEDWIFWVLLALKNKKIGHLGHTGAYYRIHSSNITNDFNKTVLYFFDAMFYIHDKLPEKYKTKFIHTNSKFILEKYASKKIYDTVYKTKIWKLLKLVKKIGRPFNVLFKMFK